MISLRSVGTAALGLLGAGVFAGATMFTGFTDTPAAEAAPVAATSFAVADGGPIDLPVGSDVIATGWGHGGWGHGGWGHGGWAHGGWGHGVPGPGWVNPGRVNGFIHSGGRGGW